MTSHLNALQVNLSNERSRLANAKTEGEKAMRKVWVAQLEKEIAGERQFAVPADIQEMTEDELLAELLK